MWLYWGDLIKCIITLDQIGMKEQSNVSTQAYLTETRIWGRHLQGRVILQQHEWLQSSFINAKVSWSLLTTDQLPSLVLPTKLVDNIFRLLFPRNCPIQCLSMPCIASYFLSILLAASVMNFPVRFITFLSLMCLPYFSRGDWLNWEKI